MNTAGAVTSLDRVKTALAHKQPDRLPVDFLAVPEIWGVLERHFGLPRSSPAASDLFDRGWETVLDKLEVDCRVLSYDQFCAPPDSALLPGAAGEWWDVPGRSTPARMWRQRAPGGASYDIFGRGFQAVALPGGSYEEVSPVLAGVDSISGARAHAWPDPSWWDFSSLGNALDSMCRAQPRHVRFRAGSVFEIAWQLTGLDSFLVDLATGSPVPGYLMDCVLDRLLAVTAAALDAAQGRIHMLYFYDDVATQESLMMSREMWRASIKPRHARLIDLARARGLSVMYHSDGALGPLLEELVDMGVDVIDPVQAGAAGMQPERLKRDHGHHLCFHGGIDIVTTLPRGTSGDVSREVRERRDVLGRSGGYIMSGCHHIQADTPLPNILAMYDPASR